MPPRRKTTPPSNTMRARGSVTVHVRGLAFAGCDGPDGVVSITYPFPSMLLPEALEWQKRSGLAQKDYWMSVGAMEPVAIQMLLWQALRRQDGDIPSLGHPWSTLQWDDVPWDDVDIFDVQPDFVGDDDDDDAEVDEDLPTTSAKEGSTRG